MLTWVDDIGAAARQKLIETVRVSASLQPAVANNWLALGRLLLKTGQFEDAAAVLDDASRRFPGERRLALMLADARRQIGEIDAALATLDGVLSRGPQDQDVWLRRFDLFYAGHDWDRVAQDLDRATEIAPGRRSVLESHSHFALSADNPAALLAVCEAALAQQPGHTGALHHKAVALARLGRNSEACFVMGMDEFVHLATLPVRDKRLGEATLLDEIAGEILRNPTLVPDPHGKATREGLQTRHLLQPGNQAVPILLQSIKRAVEHYVDRLPPSAHPFALTHPARVRLNAWAVVYPTDGWQQSHLHPAGWISGVTYVAAPRVPGEDKYRGHLVLGELNAARHPEPPPWGTREVEPIPGRIVLFPSFVPHATRSTGLPEQRICVAFDVKAVGREDNLPDN